MLPPSFCIRFLIIARMVKICLRHYVILLAWRKVKHMVYYTEIQTALDFIEKNLNKTLTVDNIAAVAGFSKYHFHRIFRNIIGIPLYEYIRKRRLAKASFLLLTTDLSILDIAVYFCFESQEAFSRAFKKVYKLPPGKYRRALKKKLDCHRHCPR